LQHIPCNTYLATPDGVDLLHKIEIPKRDNLDNYFFKNSFYINSSKRVFFVLNLSSCYLWRLCLFWYFICAVTRYSLLFSRRRSHKGEICILTLHA